MSLSCVSNPSCIGRPVTVVTEYLLGKWAGLDGDPLASNGSQSIVLFCCLALRSLIPMSGVSESCSCHAATEPHFNASFNIDVEHLARVWSSRTINWSSR
jgi:hypothetical protein